VNKSIQLKNQFSCLLKEFVLLEDFKKKLRKQKNRIRRELLNLASNKYIK